MAESLYSRSSGMIKNQNIPVDEDSDVCIIPTTIHILHVIMEKETNKTKTVYLPVTKVDSNSVWRQIANENKDFILEIDILIFFVPYGSILNG
jgi:hypothetical protein